MTSPRGCFVCKRHQCPLLVFNRKPQCHPPSVEACLRPHTLEATGDIRKVSLWLGHQSLQTTELCLRADPAEKLDMLSQWHSPGLAKGRLTGVKDELMAMLSSV